MPLDEIKEKPGKRKANSPEVNMENAQETVEANQESFLEGIRRARDYTTGKTNNYRINVNDDQGNKFFDFGIRPLKQGEFEMARKVSTQKPKRGRGGTGEFSLAKYNCEIIYKATIAEKNGLKIWDLPEVQDLCGSMRYADIIDQTINSGAQIQVVRKIEELSGYVDDDVMITLIDESKN